MSEREPQPHPEQPAESQTWELDAVAETLGAAVEPSRDVAFGAGARFQFVGETAPALELYPASGVARLTTQAAEVTLFRQSSPASRHRRSTRNTIACASSTAAKLSAYNW